MEKTCATASAPRPDPAPTPPLTQVRRIHNVRPWGGDSCDLLIDQDTIISLAPLQAGSLAEGEIDGRGMLALPGIVNAHAHVDKSWLGLPWQAYGGEPTTQGRIAHERARRDELGIPSALLTSRVIAEMVRYGTTKIRTHVDVDPGIGLRGVDAVREAVAQYEGAIQVEMVAFPQDGVLRRGGVDRLLCAAIESGVGFVGGLDPAGIDRDPVGQLDVITRIAADTGAGVDIHLHDPAELGAFQMELLCDRIEQHGLQGRVNLAHGFAVAGLPPARRRDLLTRLGSLGVSFTTVAPLRLPQLPMQELNDAGVRLGLGTDGIRDLWSPYGTGDTLGIAWQYARASSFVHDEDLLNVVRLATTDGAWAVSDQLHDLVPGARADIILVDAENPMDALVRVPPRHLVVGGGRVLHCDR